MCLSARVNAAPAFFFHDRSSHDLPCRLESLTSRSDARELSTASSSYLRLDSTERGLIEIGRASALGTAFGSVSIGLTGSFLSDVDTSLRSTFMTSAVGKLGCDRPPRAPNSQPLPNLPAKELLLACDLRAFLAGVRRGVDAPELMASTKTLETEATEGEAGRRRSDRVGDGGRLAIGASSAKLMPPLNRFGPSCFIDDEILRSDWYEVERLFLALRGRGLKSLAWISRWAPPKMPASNVSRSIRLSSDWPKRPLDGASAGGFVLNLVDMAAAS